MPDQPDFKKAKCLCLDIETSRKDRLQLKEIGAYRPDIDARARISGKASDLVAKLDKLTQGATFVLGHNIVAFDQPALSLLHPALALHQLPLLDTLELSPLAFPLNPYHRLVKDYKLCSTSRNDPVRDAELAYQLFIDQAEAFKQRILENPDEVLCLHYLLTAENGKGVANFFATLRRALRPALPEVQAAWQRVCQGKVCLSGQQQVIEQYLPDPDWRKPLAYALTWLQVSGGNSVLPPWVNFAYPKTKDLLQRERILSGLRYLLVDEYQDINADHYALISAVAGRALNDREDKLALLAVGDDDQNIYAFSGANVRFIKQFTDDYQAKAFYLTENYRSTTHIINAANRVISPARHRMKTQQAIRINHIRRDMPEGGEFAALDALAQGRAHILETPADLYAEVAAALAELHRLLGLPDPNQQRRWGRCAVIARRWETLEPLAALCRLQSIPMRLLRDDALLELHVTREAHSLLSLLKAKQRRKARVLLRWGALSRWFRRRFRLGIMDLIENPNLAMLAQFISECESSVPQCPLVVADITEALYDFRSGSQFISIDTPNAPLLLLTAHRAKGLEFDHVLILDGGGWQKASDEERRLFYVAMTRARKTLTLCGSLGSRHAFLQDCAELCVKSRAALYSPDPRLALRTWAADPKQVVLSWPGYFAKDNLIHQVIAKLKYGDALQLRLRSDGTPGWELANVDGVTVSRMAQAFRPPASQILAVRATAFLVRRGKAGEENLRCKEWEVVLPEVEYLPDS